MVKKLAVLNFLSVILTLFINYLAQQRVFNATTIGEVSEKYSNLFIPAGYAFSIWILIYIGLFASTIFMLQQAFSKGKHQGFIKKTNFWFIIANVGNCLWVLAWCYEFIGMSVILMLLILMKLIKIILNTRMEKRNAPFPVIAFYWWPICLYSGWISVAFIANVASWLKEINWQVILLSEVNWTILMTFAATILNLVMVYARNMREFALVGVWALIAIFIRHYDAQELIAYSALAGAILIFLNISYHGFINRKSNPLYKIVHSN
ncbi:tryptophan-rich sensory protein [Gramella sp. AN32]|uniref:Tryptophan-rich sensory protein n=1 Tax=Christiangramia antarctica TaxID=2058158 RepID=A0ABW5X2C3_9FLAO|nr:tryptophan-rich sensory protein [Gramella sp. AN32]MCM4155144.1 hypothetical protein [Gramella sp. AN32]